jgi:pimeloyl-ACP methyl ester carboxylesterase
MLQAFAGGTVFGERFGVGPVQVLALHGWARSSADFRAVLGPGAAGEPALNGVALDLPGFGATPPPPEAWGSRRYAEALIPVLDELGPVIVLGHSFGGRVAVHLADLRPDAVRALVLTGVPLFPATARPVRPAFGYRAVRLGRRLGLISEERLERSRQRHGSRDYREASGVVREVLVKVLPERYDDVLARLRLPVDLVWGELDRAAPLSVARTALAAIEQAELQVVLDGDHLLPTTAPIALRNALVARLT